MDVNLVPRVVDLESVLERCVRPKECRRDGGHSSVPLLSFTFGLGPALISFMNSCYLVALFGSLPHRFAIPKLMNSLRTSG